MGNFKLPEPVIHNAKAGSFECPNCGAFNKIDPKKISNKFAYTDMHTDASHYYPMQPCDQCGKQHEVVDHTMNESNYPDMRQLMNVVTEEESAQEEQIAAISQLIADRTEDENSPSKLSTEAFIGIINRMGLPMTKDTLFDLVENGKLSAIIKDANQDEIHFKGQQDIDPGEMSVDKAKDVVANMAKRAAKKGIMK